MRKPRKCLRGFYCISFNIIETLNKVVNTARLAFLKARMYDRNAQMTTKIAQFHHQHHQQSQNQPNNLGYPA